MITNLLALSFAKQQQDGRVCLSELEEKKVVLLARYALQDKATMDGPEASAN